MATGSDYYHCSLLIIAMGSHIEQQKGDAIRVTPHMHGSPRTLQ
jgi:hypothetical protein